MSDAELPPTEKAFSSTPSILDKLEVRSSSGQIPTTLNSISPQTLEELKEELSLKRCEDPDICLADRLTPTDNKTDYGQASRILSETFCKGDGDE